MLNYVNTINLSATEEKESHRLLEWLPLDIKGDFVIDQPKTVQEFSDKLRATAVKKTHKNAKFLTMC